MTRWFRGEGAEGKERAQGKGQGFFCLLLATLAMAACLALASCGSPAAVDEPQEQEDSLQGNEPIAMTLETSPQLAGPLMELAQTYNAAYPWITVEVRALSNQSSYVEDATYDTIGDAVVLSNASYMKKLRTAGLVEQGSGYTLATDSLVVVTAEGSDIRSVSKKKLVKGTYTLCVAPEGTSTGILVRQALESYGVYKSGKGSGSFKGALAQEGAVQLGDSLADVFDRVSSGRSDIAVVKATDVNRFGGVRIVGTIAADAYDPIRYRVAFLAEEAPALPGEKDGAADGADAKGEDAGSGDAAVSDGTGSAAGEGKEPRVNRTEEMQAFLDWAVSDDDAQRIWKKWQVELAV